MEALMWIKEKLLNILERIYKKRKYLLLTKDLAGDAGPASSRLEVIAIGPEHWDMLEQHIRQHHRDVARSLRMVDTYLNSRFEGHMALLDGQVIGYRWWVNRRINHPQVTLYGLTLGEHDVYTFALYIARAFRGHGYAKEFLAKVEILLREQGYTRSFNSVDIDNLPARRVHDALGSKEIGFHGYTCFLSLVVYSHGKWLRYNPMWM